MKDEEAMLFVETCLENGSGVDEALQDMRMIDNMLSAERNYILVAKVVTKTSRGYYRKNSSLHDQWQRILEGRVK